MAKSNIDFCELSNDEEFKERVLNFQSSVEEIKEIIDQIVKNDIYDSLGPEDKVRYDLFLAFSINSLYWFYQRIEGKDPNQGELKNEIKRVREYMAKSSKLYERKHLMPRIDKGAAERFVRSGLWDPNQKPETPAVAPAEPESSLKRKREDSSSGEG